MSDATQGTTWVLGFDGGCGTCGYLAQQLVDLSGGKLTARSLRSAEVQGWRERALGPDAPWAPTLFAVEGDNVRAWTGKGLIARLGRLVGPHKLWQIANLVGDLMTPAMGPTSPRRRSVIRQGLIGTAAALAMLGNGSTANQLSASAQSTASSRGLRVDRLGRGEFDDIERRAMGDRQFRIIRDYFAQEHGRDWRGGGRDAFRVTEDGRRVRDVFAASFKNPGETEWAHVLYGREANGRESTSGYLWRGRERRFTDRFFVQNGNLRRENGGRVEGAVSTAQIGGCWVDRGVCVAGTGVTCGAATVATVAICGIFKVGPCVTSTSVTAACGIFGQPLYEECKDFASGGEC